MALAFRGDALTRRQAGVFIIFMYTCWFFVFVVCGDGSTNDYRYLGVGISSVVGNLAFYARANPTTSNPHVSDGLVRTSR